MRTVRTPTTSPDDDVVGHYFKAHDGFVYYCDSWEQDRGYWMTQVADPGIRRNVSERVIGGAFRKIDPPNPAVTADGTPFHEAKRYARGVDLAKDWIAGGGSLTADGPDTNDEAFYNGFIDTLAQARRRTAAAC